MINISHIPGKVENVYISADCSSKEIMIYTELFRELTNILCYIGMNENNCASLIINYINFKSC
jgi:hypothetical protein